VGRKINIAKKYGMIADFSSRKVRFSRFIEEKTVFSAICSLKSAFGVVYSMKCFLYSQTIQG
jgi:hypothetical protein